MFRLFLFDDAKIWRFYRVSNNSADFCLKLLRLAYKNATDLR